MYKNCITEMLKCIDNNLEDYDKLDELISIIKENKISEDVLIDIIDMNIENKVDILNIISIKALDKEVFDIIIPLLNRAYELDCSNINTNYNLAYVLNLFGEGKLAMEYLLKINTEDESIYNLKLDILKKLECTEKDLQDYYIAPNCDIRGVEKIKFGSGVVVQENAWINVAYAKPDQKYSIEINDGTNIGRRAVISASNKIIIGKNVLFGPNVYISDHGHEYKDVNVPIMNQGITSITNEVIIGDGSWVGMNSVIVGDVKIGKNCVVGANSFVNKDIPDYSVAVGSPAKVIKMFDILSKEWIIINNEEEVQKMIKKRSYTGYMLPLERLRSIQVEVSSICNLKCPQCFNNIEGHISKIFSKEMWNEKIRPILKNLTEIHLVGIGEPLVCKDFFDYVEECTKLNIKVHTTSNLQLVNEEIAKKIVESGIMNLSFSCDGATQKTYEKIGINGKFDKLVSNIKLINKYKKQLNSQFPKLILNFGALECNIRELPLVVDLAKELGVDQIIAYHDVIYVEGLKDQSLYFNKQLSDEMFKKGKELADLYGIHYFYPGTFENPIKYEESKKQIYCHFPISHLWISSDGRVGPCCMDFPKRITLGNLNDSSIEDIWNDIPMLELRESVVNNVREECRWCVNHGKLDISNKKFLFRY